MGFSGPPSRSCPVLGGPPGEAGSAPLRRADRCGVSCRRRSGSPVSPVGSPLESGVSPAHIGPRNACPRAAPETTPLWRLFLIKLSLSLSVSLTRRTYENAVSGGREREKGGCAKGHYQRRPVRSSLATSHRAKQRLSAGRARDHPVMEIVPNKALSLSRSLRIGPEPPTQSPVTVPVDESKSRSRFCPGLLAHELCF